MKYDEKSLPGTSKIRLDPPYIKKCLVDITYAPIIPRYKGYSVCINLNETESISFGVQHLMTESVTTRMILESLHKFLEETLYPESELDKEVF